MEMIFELGEVVDGAVGAGRFQRELDREVVGQYIGSGVAQLLTRALNGTGWSDIPQAVQLFRKHYADHLLDKTRFYPHAPEILAHFSTKMQAVFSNKPEGFVRDILSGLEHLHAFQSIIGGDSLDVKKPDPKGVFLLMEKFGLHPEEVVMVGDSAVDIETGKQAGVHNCAVTFGFGDPAALEASRPDSTIDDLSQLKQHFH